jgi:hypothetical protein
VAGEDAGRQGVLRRRGGSECREQDGVDERCEVVLTGLLRERERRLEQRVRGLEVAARPVHAAALEVQPDVRGRVRARERLGLVQ